MILPKILDHDVDDDWGEQYIFDTSAVTAAQMDSILEEYYPGKDRENIVFSFYNGYVRTYELL